MREKRERGREREEDGEGEGGEARGGDTAALCQTPDATDEAVVMRNDQHTKTSLLLLF